MREVEAERDHADLLGRARCRGPRGPASPTPRPPRARRAARRAASRASGRGPSSPARSSRAARGRGRCARRWARRAARAASAAEEPRLRGVRVDDGRPPRAHEAREAHERAQVRKRRDLAAEPGHRLAGHVLLRREREHVALARRLRAHDQPRLVAQGTKTGAQEDHVNRRTPDVQAGEDPEDAQSSSPLGA